MGICDYTDFVQRNDQYLYTFNASHEDESCGNSECILVMVPDSYSKRDILSFRLNKFAEFNYILAEYNWDTRKFTAKNIHLKQDGCNIIATLITANNDDDTGTRENKIKGYNKALNSNDWWDRSVWSSSSYSGYLLVNFDPDVYSGLVLEKLQPKLLHKFYIKTLFANRGDYHNGMGNRYRVRGISKNLIYEKIMNSAKENLFEYDKCKLLTFNLPEIYTTLLTKLNEHPVLKQSYVYQFKTPTILSKARLAVLIHDNIRVNTTVPVLEAGTEDYRMPGYDTYRSDLVVRFGFALDTKIPESYLNRCCYFNKEKKRCKYFRYIGSYWCLNHITLQDATLNIMKARVERQISRYCNTHLIPNLKRMDEISIPESIDVNFIERDVNYNIKLEYRTVYQNVQNEGRLGHKY